MLIRDVINQHIKAERLFSIEPKSHKDTRERWVVVTPDVHRHLYGPWEDEAHESRGTYALTDFMAIAAGEPRVVSLTGRKHKKSQLARMENADEAWEIRLQEPRPGLRCTARFAERDVLVGFDIKARSVDIPWLPEPPIRDDELRFELLKIECEARWNALFPDHAPVRGEQVSDYISDATLLS